MAKQERVPVSFAGTKRMSQLQNDLVAIAYAMGSSRPKLQRSGPWYEVCRDPNSYEPSRPYERLQEMVRDAVSTVSSRGTDQERKQVRAAVTLFYEQMKDDALEALDTASDESVLKLCTDEMSESAEAHAAIVQALDTKTPENFEKAERETLQSLTATERVYQALQAARARFITPRTVRALAR